MKTFQWSNEKNEWLKKHRKISFEEVVNSLTEIGPIDVLDGISLKHPGQSVFVIRLKQYFYVVPFSESADEVFLITAFPSRKMKKKYGAKL
jgi:hypothetical protein